LNAFASGLQQTVPTGRGASPRTATWRSSTAPIRRSQGNRGSSENANHSGGVRGRSTASSSNEQVGAAGEGWLSDTIRAHRPALASAFVEDPRGSGRKMARWWWWRKKLHPGLHRVEASSSGRGHNPGVCFTRRSSGPSQAGDKGPRSKRSSPGPPAKLHTDPQRARGSLGRWLSVDGNAAVWPPHPCLAHGAVT